jgi:hypothetical protein
MLLACGAVSVLTGCISEDAVHFPDYSQASLGFAESRVEMIHKGLDRAATREKLGPPTIEHGNEWVYVAKYRHVECVPFGLLFSIYDNRWEQWGTAVIKFDSTGHVASIRIGFVPSDAPDFPLYWTVMGFHFEKSDKINVTTTQRATKGSSDTMPTP